MRKYERFFQMNADCFTPFNEAPAYLKGSVSGTADDKIEIVGKSMFQINEWYKMGCITCKLVAHSFAFSVDAVPSAAVGAYSIGIHGDCTINVSHFLRNSIQLLTPQYAENAYSGWAYNNSGTRSQQGGTAPWESLGRRHNLMVMHDARSHTLLCMVNGFPIHAVNGSLREFSLAIRFEAVGIAGDFAVTFENLCYYSLDSDWSENVSRLKAWDPQYAPVFVSYSHADKAKVEPFVADLRRVGVDSLQTKISQSISRAGYLIVMLSAQSVKSPWVEKELQIGMNRELKERRVHVLPILLEDCDLPLFLADKLYADLRENCELARDKVLEILHRYGAW
jgi:hypothetical protein